MKKTYLSIIIPTYNRSDCLNECLHHLERQSLDSRSFEIIVVNDGSTDDTKEILDAWKKKNKSIKVIHKENEGQGRARNLGIDIATGDVILFIGDDIYAGKDFLKAHYDFHKKHTGDNAACLGLTEWYPIKPISDFMKWLVNGGPQFAYKKLKPGQKTTFWYFYTSNISLKTKLLRNEKFDESYTGYGWEDIELAYRLTKKFQLKITYCPSALAYHDHYMAEDSLKVRMISVGRNANLFQLQHPELNILPGKLKRSILRTSCNKLSLKIIRPFSKKIYWYILSKMYFMEGVNQNIRKQ